MPRRARCDMATTATGGGQMCVCRVVVKDHPKWQICRKGSELSLLSKAKGQKIHGLLQKKEEIYMFTTDKSRQ